MVSLLLSGLVSGLAEFSGTIPSMVPLVARFGELSGPGTERRQRICLEVWIMVKQDSSGVALAVVLLSSYVLKTVHS